jgi:signal transduction histidine kinase
LRDLGGRLITSQEDERRRVARELHDDFNQRLSLLSVELEQASLQLPESPARMRELMQDLSNRTKELSTAVHRLSHQLHPAKLEHLGLVAAVKSFCKEVSEQEGIRIEFTHREVPTSIPEDVALCLYRIVQEALRNVVKHSGAGDARVELTGGRDAIRLQVSDPGVGFEPDPVKSNGGLGLVSMRERLRLVGGKLSIQSQPSRGTRIDVRVPLAATGS